MLLLGSLNALSDHPALCIRMVSQGCIHSGTRVDSSASQSGSPRPVGLKAMLCLEVLMEGLATERLPPGWGVLMWRLHSL